MEQRHDFFAQPILNSPYEEPRLHHDLDETGQPTNRPSLTGRRRSSHYSPVPKPKRSKAVSPDQMDLLDEQIARLNPHDIINEIRGDIKTWRSLPNPADWGVTPTTQRLLQFWRDGANFHSVRPFFCQVEAVETLIWLSEVARPSSKYRRYWTHIEQGNAAANPELLRVALKMATGAGKTTVMAMLIAWQTLNAVRSAGSKTFTDGFLVITPGITIKDRLRVLQPAGPDSYYATRGLVPSDMLPDLDRAKVVITNYHAFQRREKTSLAKGTRSALSGWREEEIQTAETEGEMLRRAVGDLMGTKNILVINDEAHHCYRENPDSREKKDQEGKENSEAARLWINGIEAVQRHMGLLGVDPGKERTRNSVAGVVDLSATPFFLAGSGYPEAALFPWTVSDFSLMDAIECGIVKLPRVPILDDMPTADGQPIYRNIWDHIGKKMPKGRVRGAATGKPADLPLPLQTALKSLYGHYEKTDAEWLANGHDVPPVFIVVCNNTATSQLVHDWISGYETPATEAEAADFKPANLSLFTNFDDYGQRLPRPNTFLIDSAQFDSGEAVSDTFKKEMAPEIELFRRQYPNETITDEMILREVMNTVGQKGRLGGSIRCVVSVSMLTEGWDANTVTHIMGVRAFGTQLLCEQVVGRALRRKSYELNEHGLFDVEYADIMGIPFEFTKEPTKAAPAAPKPTTRVAAVKDRADLEMRFPRVDGYRTELPDARIEADFNEDSVLHLKAEMVGPGMTLMSGIVGIQETIEARQAFANLRPSSIAMHVTKRLLATRFRDPDSASLNMNMFAPVQRIVKRWLEEGHLKCADGAVPGMLAYEQLADMAAEKIFLAHERANQRLAKAGESSHGTVKVILDPYNPEGSTRHVAFITSKRTFATDPRKSHISHVVEDSVWEAKVAGILEAHPCVLAYAKNQGLGLEIPYRKGSSVHRYLPDFVIRLGTEGEALNLILEVKGQRDVFDQMKAETAKTLWVPGVNNVGRFGRWEYVELRDFDTFESEFNRVVADLCGARAGGAV